MSNVGRPRLTQSTSTFRDIHEDGGLKPAQKRRLELLEGRIQDFDAHLKVIERQKTQVSDLHKQLTTVNATLGSIQRQLSTVTTETHNLDAKSNALQEAYVNASKSVDSLNADVDVLRSVQDHLISSREVEWDLQDIRHNIESLKNAQIDLEVRNSKEKSIATSLSQRLDGVERLGEETSKRLKVYHESQESLEDHVGQVNHFGKSLAQRLESQQLAVEDAETQRLDLRNEVEHLANDLYDSQQRFDDLKRNCTHLYTRHKQTASLVGQVPILQSRVDNMQHALDDLQENTSRHHNKHTANLASHVPNLQSRVALLENTEVPHLQRSLDSCIKSNELQLDALRKRVLALETRQQQPQLPQNFTVVEGNIQKLNTLVTQLENKIEFVEQLQNHQMIGDKKHTAAEQRLDADLATLKREMTELNQRRDEMIDSIAAPLSQDTSALAAEMKNALSRLDHLESSAKQAVKASSELMAYAKAPTTDQCTIYRKSYVSWLCSLDFRLPDGMKGFKDRLVRVDDHMLFTRDGLQYFLRRTDRFSNEPKRSQRDQRGFLDDDAYESAELHYFEYSYRLSGYEAVHKSGLCEDDRSRLPQYMVHLGEVYIHGHWQGFCRKQVTNTGFHLFMDISKPAKPLWIVFCREASNGVIETLGEQWKMFNSLLAEPFDIAMVAESVYDWNQQEAPDYDEPRLDVSKVQSCMEGSAEQSEAVFTYPNLKALFKTLNDGWCEGSDVLPCST